MVNKRHYTYYNNYYWFINLFFYNLVYLLLRVIMSDAMQSHSASKIGYVMSKRLLTKPEAVAAYRKAIMSTSIIGMHQTTCR